MPKINLDFKFPDLDGKPIQMGPDKDMTLRDAMKIVCTAEIPSDTQGGSQEVLATKMNNFEIYLKVREAESECDITAEEAVHIKKRAPFILNTLVLGPVMKLLEGKEPYSREVK